MELNENVLSNDLQVDITAAAHLRETAKWAKFLAILGFVLSAFLVLAGIFAGSFLSGFSKMGDSAAAGMISPGFISIIYIIIAVVYVMLSLFLYRFATKMLATLQHNDQQQFNDSLNNLRLVYKITGIIVVIYLCFLVLAMVVGIGFTMMK
ncbi:MAG: DUF5362 family protein [Ferruginibacter sp.]